MINWDSNNFDCESMIAGNDHLYLFSKNRGDQQSKLYSIPKEPGTYAAKLIDSFDSRGLITGAALDLETNMLALVGYTYKSWQPFIWLLYDFENEDFFSVETAGASTFLTTPQFKPRPCFYSALSVEDFC